MKKILLAPPQELPIPATKGGAVETLMDILIEENEKRHKVEFVFLSIYDEEAEEISKNYKYTKIIYTPKSSLFVKKSYGLLVNKIFRNIFKLSVLPRRIQDFKLIKKIDDLDYDCIVSQSYFTDLFKFVKHIPKKENMFFHSHSNMLPTEIEDTTYGNLISVSEYIESCWIKKSENKQLKTSVVHNCIREELFSERISLNERTELRKKFSFDKDDFVILFCGRITEVKGVRELLKAIQKINNSKIKLLIIGSANFALQNKSDYVIEVNDISNSMQERVKYTGYIDNKLLYKYYQTADIQVVPSLWEEAAGLVAIEGMASGLPLIVTRSGGMVEYVDEQCATIIEKDENVVNNIKTAIEYLYNNPKQCKKMSEQGKERAKLFSKKRFYDEFINSILN